MARFAEWLKARNANLVVESATGTMTDEEFEKIITESYFANKDVIDRLISEEIGEEVEMKVAQAKPDLYAKVKKFGRAGVLALAALLGFDMADAEFGGDRRDSARPHEFRTQIRANRRADQLMGGPRQAAWDLDKKLQNKLDYIKAKHPDRFTKGPKLPG